MGNKSVMRKLPEVDDPRLRKGKRRNLRRWGWGIGDFFSKRGTLRQREQVSILLLQVYERKYTHLAFKILSQPFLPPFPHHKLITLSTIWKKKKFVITSYTNNSVKSYTYKRIGPISLSTVTFSHASLWHHSCLVSEWDWDWNWEWEPLPVRTWWFCLAHQRLVCNSNWAEVFPD